MLVVFNKTEDRRFIEACFTPEARLRKDNYEVDPETGVVSSRYDKTLESLVAADEDLGYKDASPSTTEQVEASSGTSRPPPSNLQQTLMEDGSVGTFRGNNPGTAPMVTAISDSQDTTSLGSLSASESIRSRMTMMETTMLSSLTKMSTAMDQIFENLDRLNNQHRDGIPMMITPQGKPHAAGGARTNMRAGEQP